MNRVILFAILFLCLVCHAFRLSAQRKEDGWIPYERGFEFNKGIYLSFEDFKNNRPGVPGNFENNNGVLYVEDSLKKFTPLRKKAWGYTNGKNIYLNTYSGYTRIGIIGELSFFGIVNTGGSNGTSVGVSSAGAVGIGLGVGTSSNSVNEYLLDFITGQFVPFNRKNFEAILAQRDPLLLEQYKKHKGKKKEKMHIFLSAYNDKHPIYFHE